jgi:hypothetical protein
VPSVVEVEAVLDPVVLALNGEVVVDHGPAVHEHSNVDVAAVEALIGDVEREVAPMGFLQRRRALGVPGALRSGGATACKSERGNEEGQLPHVLSDCSLAKKFPR